MCQQHDSIDIIPLVQIQGFLQHFVADHLPCPPVSPVTKVKYGPDISFEVCDKTNRTVELGNVQMTIDKTETKNNITYLKGGFGVQVIDPPAMSDKPSTNRNIMYVDNGGTLFINQINLGGQILSVDGSGKLKWGDKYVSLSD